MAVSDFSLNFCLGFLKRTSNMVLYGKIIDIFSEMGKNLRSQPTFGLNLSLL